MGRGGVQREMGNGGGGKKRRDMIKLGEVLVGVKGNGMGWGS